MKDRSRRIGLIVKDYDRGRLAKAKPSGLFNVGAGGPRWSGWNKTRGVDLINAVTSREQLSLPHSICTSLALLPPLAITSPPTSFHQRSLESNVFFPSSHYRTLFPDNLDE